MTAAAAKHSKDMQDMVGKLDAQAELHRKNMTGWAQFFFLKFFSNPL
jgi:hypothetical protein